MLRMDNASINVPCNLAFKLDGCALAELFCFLFYLPYLSSIHEKANCIAILWTGSPHSLGSVKSFFTAVKTIPKFTWQLVSLSHCSSFDSLLNQTLSFVLSQFIFFGLRCSSLLRCCYSATTAHIVAEVMSS